MLPSLILFAFFVWEPLLASVRLSFYKTKGMRTIEFVGLKNFADVLAHPDFLASVRNTFMYTIWSLIIGFLILIILAVVINEMVYFKSLFRVGVYFPNIVPGLATVLMWGFIFRPGKIGVLNVILGGLGIDPMVWLGNPKITIPLIVITMTCKGAGATSLIYLAALQGINPELYEATIIDGAGISGSVVAGIVFNGLLAFAISIIRPKGSKIVFALVLGSLMVPATTGLVPLFININTLGLSGTFYPLWFSVGANAIFVILFKKFFDALPISIIEAARLDGCSNIQTFIRIVTPLSKPIIMVVAMYAINAAWSDFLLPYLVLNNTGHDTVMVRLFQFRNGKTSDVDILRAIVFAIVPLVVLFTAFQKQIMHFSYHSGIKG